MAKKKKPKRQVSIVVLTYNNLHYTQECFASLYANTRDYEIIAIDNDSQDGTREYLKELEAKWPELRVVLNDENLGFAGGCNQGVELASHELICLLNNDTVPFPGWLSAMKAAMRKNVGIVGAKLLFPDGTIQHAGVFFPHYDTPVPHFRPNHRCYREPGHVPEANRQEEVAGVTAACLLTSKTVWREVGGLDPSYVKANYEDVDFNLKTREAGYKVVYQPAATLIHFEHGTIRSLRGTEEDPMQHWEANLELLNERWYDKLAAGLAASGPKDRWAPGEARVSRAFAELRSVHDGETCYIVGKGPSLQHLTAGDLGPGPIITLNQALLAVQKVAPPNPLYSMQKDGCRALMQLHGGCEGCDGQRLHMTYPEKETTSLLLHAHESKFCLPDHERRYVFDAVADLGFDLFTRTSAMCAVRIAQFMGCREIVFVSHDSVANGDTRTFVPSAEEPTTDTACADDYVIAGRWLLDLVADFPHRFLTPGADARTVSA